MSCAVLGAPRVVVHVVVAPTGTKLALASGNWLVDLLRLLTAGVGPISTGTAAFNLRSVLAAKRTKMDLWPDVSREKHAKRMGGALRQT